MKVAVLAHSFPRFPGDTHGPFVKRLSEALAEQGHQVWALVPFDPELRPDAATPLTIRSFRYVWPDSAHLLGYSRTLRRDVGLKLTAYLEAPLYFYFAERALARLVREEGIELIHAHWILPNGYVAWRVARRAGIPYCATLHGSDVFMAERNPLFRRLAGRALAGAAHVTSCSAELRDRLLAVGGEEHGEKVLLVPNGTDLVLAPGGGTEGTRHEEATPPGGELRGGAWEKGGPLPDGEPDSGEPKPAGVEPKEERALRGGETESVALPGGLARDGGERLVVAVGRLVDKKGFAYLLEAAPQILAADPAVRLVFGGGGELLDELQAQARRLGIADRVTFTGGLSHPEVLDLIAAAELFVMPSVRDPRGNVDGLPIVVLEAMAAARPVVATDVSGMTLAVADGETGLLVPEKDPEALAGAATTLLADPARARRLGETGRRRVESELNWPAIAAHHDRLYREAVAASG